MVAINDQKAHRRARSHRSLLVGRFGIWALLGVCYIWCGAGLYSSFSGKGTDGITMLASIVQIESTAILESFASKDAPIDRRTEDVPRYSTENIAKTVRSLSLAPNRLLIYSRGSFLTYTVAPQDAGMMKYGGRCNRCRLILPMLVNALLECCGERFDRRRPPFQMLLSDADFTYSNCTLPGQSCDASNFAPLVHWGSVLRDASVLPFVHTFPNPNFLACMREWYLNKSISDCTVWVPPFVRNASWSDLIPQVVWRGSPFNFLETVGVEYFNARNETSVPGAQFHPRGAAVRMSKRAARTKDTIPWINIMNAQKVVMTPSEMAAYRYQIDIGGAGGTSWTGTLEKLAMPGLLLHHETPAMDWFYSELIPWKHYVPIRTDLTDLKDKYDWAERNAQRAQEIARAGTSFARSFFSSRNLEGQYKRFFDRTNLIGLVDAYDNEGAEHESLHSILEAYRSMGIEYNKVSTCTRRRCFTQTLHGSFAFALNSSECFKVSNISTPIRVGQVKACYS